MGAFTAWWSSARFGWGRVWSSAAVSTEPFPALPSSGKSETRSGSLCYWTVMRVRGVEERLVPEPVDGGQDEAEAA